jgi:predicted GH43/DUF377 family glycosyl hydrolase
MCHPSLHLFAVCLLGASTAHAVEVRFAGYALDTPDWIDAVDPKNPASSAASGMKVVGWTMFGGESPEAEFAEASRRRESLPGFVAEVAAGDETQVVQFGNFALIQSAGGASGMWLSGALSRMNAAVPVDLVTIKLGPVVPKIWRVGVLIDNLDNPGYTPAQLALVVDGRESDPVMTTGGAGSANSAPDWYFWDVAGAKDNSEVTLRVSPGNGVAAIGGLVFLAGEEPRHIGEFSRDGEYLKDYYVFKEGDTYHLFYNVGTAAEVQNWEQPGNEKAFGHATSKDLKTWEHHPRILEVVPGTWEGEVVSAPSIIKRDGTFYMFYTGFDDRVKGKQSIGLATSQDLFNWERHPGNPVYEAPPWAARNESGWLDCRDAHVIKSGDEFLMFTMVTTAEGKGAIALASSSDLIAWKDLGPAVVTFTTPESPRVFEHDGFYYMFASSAHGKELFKTANPKTGPWESLSFRWPSPGLWSGWEVVEDGDRTIFSAFEWKPFGNHIRFWNVRWKDGIPSVVY